MVLVPLRPEPTTKTIRRGTGGASASGSAASTGAAGSEPGSGVGVDPGVSDDMRDSPAIAVVQTLQDAGATIRAFDPEGQEQARKMLENIEYCEDAYDAMKGADALVIITEWDVFRALDLKRAKELLSQPVLVDLRNIYPREQVEAAGFTYTAVGR